MTILNCPCGNELYVTGEGATSAWQCDTCGRWINLFEQEVEAPQEMEENPIEDFTDPLFDL